MLTLLHLADIHFDTIYAGRTLDLRRRLREAQQTAFERAVDRALEEPVNAVLIAGDLFDAERLGLMTEIALLDQLRRLEAASIPVVYATGDHDPGPTRGRAASIDWPANVHLVRSADPRVIPLTDDDGERIGQVVAVGHPRAQVSENLAIRFPEAETDLPTVGLLHAHLEDAEDAPTHDRYAPCTAADLQRPGYDYWALGHIHRGQQVNADVPAYYAGNLQGRNPDETGVKGGLLVRIPPNGPPDVTVQPFAPIRWETLVLDDLAHVQSVDALAGTLKNAFRAVHTQALTTEWMVRVRLRGACPMAKTLHNERERRALAKQLTARLNVLDVELVPDMLTPPVEVAPHEDEPHLAGEVLALIKEVGTDDDRLADLAGRATWAHPGHATPAARRTYLRDLLTGLDREALTRLLVDAE
jgi:DNA repair exonuclease SbcCD nuclease subunit